MTENTLWRNSKMQDVDFYITKIEADKVIGYWVLRSCKAIMKCDEILKSRIITADWKKVLI